GHRVRAPGVRRRPPRNRLPLRRLAAPAGGGDRRAARELAAPARSAGVQLPSRCTLARVKPGERVTVTCVDLDDDGAGVTAPGAAGAASDHPRVHVAGALPDERVAAVVEHVSGHAPEAWARLMTIETPSPARRRPACRAFGSCGGCVLQHL